MNTLSHTVLPSSDVHDYEYSGGGLAWEADRLQAKPLTLHIPKSPPLNAPIVPAIRANAYLVHTMSNGTHPEVAERAGRVTKIDDIINMHDSEDDDDDDEQEEDFDGEGTGRDDAEDDDQEEVEADQEEADPEDHVRGNDQAYVLSASDRALSPRGWPMDLSQPRCGDLNQAAQCRAPRTQEAQSSSHRVKLPTLEADHSDSITLRDISKSPLPAPRARPEQPVWGNSVSPTSGHASPYMNLAARALATTPKPLSSASNGNSLSAPLLGLSGNDQAAEKDRGPSPHLAVPVDVRLSSPSGTVSQHLAGQTRLLDPGSAMARRASSSSSTHTASRRGESLGTNFSTASLSTSTSSYSPIDRHSPYSPQSFSRQSSSGPFQPTSPNQRQFPRQPLPPIQSPNAPSHLDTEATITTACRASASVDNGQQQQSLPSIHEVFQAIGVPPSHSTPVSPNGHTYKGFSPPAGGGEEIYAPISRRATTDCSGGMGDPAPPARDTPQPLRRAATAPKYPSIAPQIDNDKGGGVRRSQPTIAAATPQLNAQSQQGQQPHAPAGGFRCPEPNCKALPFLTQYQLSSHANVHSSERPHFCSVPECPHSKPGNGFKRKNEMIRHGLVHRSPGYTCPFCPGRKHKYPRRDNLRRHVRGAHKDKSKDDPQLLHVLAQRPEGTNNSRRRQGA